MGDDTACQIGQVQLELHHLTTDDWQVWREVRLQALAEAPHAFGSSLASWQGAGDTEERWRDRLGNVPFNVVATVDGRPSGQVSGTALDDDGTVELISLWVVPYARSTGLGDQLINEVIRWAANQGAGAVTLSVKTNNTFAIRLYERMGFGATDSPADPGEQVMSRPIP